MTSQTLSVNEPLMFCMYEVSLKPHAKYNRGKCRDRFHLWIWKKHPHRRSAPPKREILYPPVNMVLIWTLMALNSNFRSKVPKIIGSYLFRGPSDQTVGPLLSFTIETNETSLTEWFLLVWRITITSVIRVGYNYNVPTMWYLYPEKNIT